MLLDMATMYVAAQGHKTAEDVSREVSHFVPSWFRSRALLTNPMVVYITFNFCAFLF